MWVGGPGPRHHHHPTPTPIGGAAHTVGTIHAGGLRVRIRAARTARSPHADPCPTSPKPRVRTGYRPPPRDWRARSKRRGETRLSVARPQHGAREFRGLGLAAGPLSLARRPPSPLPPRCSRTGAGCGPRLFPPPGPVGPGRRRGGSQPPQGCAVEVPGNSGGTFDGARRRRYRVTGGDSRRR
eukprot:gene16988-biopygen23313